MPSVGVSNANAQGTLRARPPRKIIRVLGATIARDIGSQCLPGESVGGGCRFVVGQSL